MTNVFVVRVGTEILGVFTDEIAAKVRLADFVVDPFGPDFDSAAITEHTIRTSEPEVDPRSPLNYPDVIAALIEQKKIQAIKRLREQVPGMGLREAKDLVEAVDLLNLPEALLVEALKIIEAEKEAAEAEKAELARKREELTGEFVPVVDWRFYSWIRDREGDLWGHNGDGNYVLLNDRGGRDEFQTPLSVDEIDSSYGIKNRSDERDEV